MRFTEYSVQAMMTLLEVNGHTEELAKQPQHSMVLESVCYQLYLVNKCESAEYTSHRKEEEG